VFAKRVDIVWSNGRNGRKAPKNLGHLVRDDDRAPARDRLERNHAEGFEVVRRYDHDVGGSVVPRQVLVWHEWEESRQRVDRELSAEMVELLSQRAIADNEQTRLRRSRA